MDIHTHTHKPNMLLHSVFGGPKILLTRVKIRVTHSHIRSHKHTRAHTCIHTHARARSYTDTSCCRRHLCGKTFHGGSVKSVVYYLRYKLVYTLTAPSRMQTHAYVYN